MRNGFADIDIGDVNRAAPNLDWSPRPPSWDVVIPFHNERGYLPKCIKSLAAQTVRPRLILVDNDSRDGSGEIARQICGQLGMEAIHLNEARPGKVAALQCGIASVTSDLVATCDADTIYPERYLEVATRLLGRRNAVAAVAATSPANAAKWQILLSGLRMELTAAVLRQQCLNGGAGHVFKTSELRAAGGFDPAIWNWVLEDHEVMARVARRGDIAHHRAFYCHPAKRPRGLNDAEWSLLERLRYHATPHEDRMSFFHEFLAPRFKQRALSSDKLRRLDASLVGPH